MDDSLYLIGVFVCMGAVTFAERALPFVSSRWLERQRFVKSLGDFLPLAIMVILVLHSCVSAALGHGGWPLPEILAVSLTCLLQWFTRNVFLSIFAGTALYVVLFNLGVF